MCTTVDLICMALIFWRPNAKKGGPFLGAAIRPRKGNTKSEPQLSGLTLCVPVSGPLCGLSFGAASGVNVQPKNGPDIWYVCSPKTRPRRGNKTDVYGAVGWYGCEGVWRWYCYMSKPMWPKWKQDAKRCGFGIAV